MHARLHKAEQSNSDACPQHNAPAVTGMLVSRCRWGGALKEVKEPKVGEGSLNEPLMGDCTPGTV